MNDNDIVIDDMAPLPLGEQPFEHKTQTIEEHFEQRETAKSSCLEVLTKLKDFTQNLLDNLQYSEASRATGSTRSHLTYVINMSQHLIDTLPR